MIYYSLLLLLIALATITLATQPVKRDASEGQSNPEGCISDWRGLKKAYLERQSSADVENSIFDFYPSDAINYGVLVMFYDVGPLPNTSTSGRRECCQRGSKDCIIRFIYRFRIFRDIHPALLHSRAGHHFHNTGSLSSYQVTQLCWSPPLLCNNNMNRTRKILHEFSEQFVGLVLEEANTDDQVSAYLYTAAIRFSTQSALATIPILLFATVGLFLVLYIHHSWGLVGTVLAHSQVARHSMRSTMLASWILFPCGMVQFYTVTKAMADTIREKAPLTLFHDIYTPQVTAGYVQWGSFMAILLLEAPFLCVFFLCKSADLHNRKQRHSKTNCCLCQGIRVLGDTLGGIGVMGAVQITSVYLFYNALYLVYMVSPIYIIASVSNVAAHLLVVIVCITMLLQMVSSCCKTCSFERIIKGLAFLLLGLLCVAINFNVVIEMRGDKHNYQNSFRGLLTSLVSSVVIGIYGYIVKKVLFQKKEDLSGAEGEDLESAPLIQKVKNIP